VWRHSVTWHGVGRVAHNTLAHALRPSTFCSSPPTQSRELDAGNDLITVQRALFTLCDVSSAPQTLLTTISWNGCSHGSTRTASLLTFLAMMCCADHHLLAPSLSAQQLLRNPRYESQVISAGVPAQLGGLAGHANATVREKATEALCHVAGHSIGRTHIVESGLVKVLASKVGGCASETRHDPP